jgi:hypothetical protein
MRQGQVVSCASILALMSVSQTIFALSRANSKAAARRIPERSPATSGTAPKPTICLLSPFFQLTTRRVKGQPEFSDGALVEVIWDESPVSFLRVCLAIPI